MHSPTLVFMSVLVTVVACQEDVHSPSAPQSTSALAAASAAALSFVQVSAGDGFHTCGVTMLNRAYCWGQNHAGQLGDGTTENRSTPVLVAGGLRFLQVSAGDGYTCGVTTGNQAYCWGQNVNARLGDGTTRTRVIPVAVLGGRRFRQIDAATTHTCGVTTANEAFCWGSNRYGKLGNGATITQRYSPVLVGGGHHFIWVEAGTVHSCGLATTRRVFCWGKGEEGRIGDGFTLNRWTPRRAVATGAFNARQVVVGGSHSCSVTDNGAFCWGQNLFGQLGDGSTTNRVVTTFVTGGSRFSSVDAGDQHTCAVGPDNMAYCWGANYYGQLGNGEVGDGGDRLTPTIVSGDIHFKSVSSGRTHSCGVSASNAAYCWGANTAGQLGDGDPTFSSPTPVPVAGPM